MVKAIIFDFWGTLVENGVWSPIKQVKRILNIKAPFPEYVVRMERAMMTEKFDSLKDAFTNVCKEFNLHPPEEVIDELVGMWNKNWMLAKPYDETVESLKALRENHKVILVSNTDCLGVNNVLEKFNMKELFDKIFLSCDVHMIKTDKNFLKMVVDELSVDVKDCVLVGDSMQSDIMAAKKLDMDAILIDRRNTRDYQKRIKNLKEVTNLL